jgi:hypothetical protein
VREATEELTCVEEVVDDGLPEWLAGKDLAKVTVEDFFEPEI